MKKLAQTLWTEILPRAPVFTTAQAAQAAGLALSNASRDLASLAKQGVIVRIRRGLWAVPGHPDFSPYVVVPYLAGGDEEGYVSLLSAMNLHGMIEQIPGRIQVVAQRWRSTRTTPVGTFEFHQVSEDLFGGYEPYGTAGRFLLATPEKAVFDLLYLSAQRGKRFARLPEMELPRRFRRSEIRRWAKKLSSPAYRAAVLSRAAALEL